MRPKRLLFYCLLPFMIIMAIVGFPLNVAPPPKDRPQEQSQKVDDER